MEPFEIMISESQERMLCVVEPERLDDVLALCERWDVRATAIGEVTDTQHLRVFDGDELVGDMPVDALVDDVPLYDLEPEEPSEPIYPDPPARLDAGAPPGDERCWRCSPRPTSRRSASSSSSTTRSSARARCGGPQSADAAVLVLEPDGGSGALAVIDRRQRPAGGLRSRTRARSRPCSSARATSPASARSRSGSPTA